MTESRFRRRRAGVNGVGAPGAAHYQGEARFVRMREYARAMVATWVLPSSHSRERS
jgi:hypothetical protein